ncbi:MAG: hypothetical protein WCA38_18580 [Candidatus Acidiferrales bacterium]
MTIEKLGVAAAIRRRLFGSPIFLENIYQPSKTAHFHSIKNDLHPDDRHSSAQEVASSQTGKMLHNDTS